MKLILMGTPNFVTPIFDEISKYHDIVAVFTRGPKPVGRKHIITKSPVHIWAENKNIPVFTRISEIETLQKPDYIVVCAYGVILKQSVLDFAPSINIHPSLLPLYRGPSPIQTVIINGDTESGVCLMNMALEVDAGDILMTEKFSIGENDTTEIIENIVSKIAPKMVLKYLESPNKYLPIPQKGEPSFTKKFTKEDEIIDLDIMPLEKIHNIVRAIGGRTNLHGLDVKILETKIIDDKLEILRVQPAGSKPMTYKDFENGHRNA